ncbi:unnamed protein product [Cunninghamella blakesleeana]
MDPTEFPPLTADPSLDTSWAHVVDQDLNEASTHGSFTSSTEDVSTPPSYAAAAGQQHEELEQKTENPTPQEQVEGKPLPEITYNYAPPNPDRSYAAITSHKGFPTLEESNEIEKPKSNDLSELPDVKEMLEGPSVPPISPPPTSMSFAKIAAKPTTSPPSPPVSPRKIPETTTKEKETTPPSIDNHQDFPLLSSSPSNENNNSNNGHQLNQSYSQITKNNLDQAPPAAVSKINAQPVYNENHLMTESAKREVRKWNQLLNNGDIENMTPEMARLQKEQIQQIVEEQEQEKGGDQTKSQQSASEHPTKLTLINTASRLRENGYSWLTAIPTAFLLHLRYSPLTSPYRFPFIYHSISDIISLPIYTKHLKRDFAKKHTHLLLQGSTENLNVSISKYGTTQGNTVGLKLKDGFRLLKEKEHLHWWQYGIWTSHRLQWVFLYMLLEDSKSHLVTSESLLSLEKITVD